MYIEVHCITPIHEFIYVYSHRFKFTSLQVKEETEWSLEDQRIFEDGEETEQHVLESAVDGLWPSFSVAAAAVGYPPSPKEIPSPFDSPKNPFTFAAPTPCERKPPLEEEAAEMVSSDEESMRRGVGGNSSTDPMLQELEIMTARCEEDSTDRMLQELETVTGRWEEDSIPAKWGAKFEKNME